MPADVPSGDAAMGDAGKDAAHVPACDPAGAFDAPVPLDGFATSANEVSARPSPDELSVYVSSNRTGSLNNSHDLYVAQRNTVGDPFGEPSALTALNTNFEEYDATISPDGLTIVFASNSGETDGTYHLWFATRTSALGEFRAPSKLAGVGVTGTVQNEVSPFFTADGNELWFVSNRTTSNYDVYHAARAGAGFANPAVEPGLNTVGTQQFPVLSADRLTVYIATDRGPATQGFDIWSAHRTTTSDGFPVPTPVANVNTAAPDRPYWLSPDNCRLYLGNNVAIFVATRHPQ
jgi:Tol biopolymer transport system component